MCIVLFLKQNNISANTETITRPVLPVRVDSHKGQSHCPAGNQYLPFRFAPGKTRGFSEYRVFPARVKSADSARQAHACTRAPCVRNLYLQTARKRLIMDPQSNRPQWENGARDDACREPVAGENRRRTRCASTFPGTSPASGEEPEGCAPLQRAERRGFDPAQAGWQRGRPPSQIAGPEAFCFPSRSIGKEVIAPCWTST